MMRALLWASRIFIFLFLFAFAIKNTDPVSVRFFFDAAWQAPLVIVVLAFFAGGAALGALSLLGTIFGLRREANRLRRELRLAQTAQLINQEASSSARNPSIQ
jgi:uncharacterized integral membrane protein